MFFALCLQGRCRMTRNIISALILEIVDVVYTVHTYCIIPRFTVMYYSTHPMIRTTKAVILVLGATGTGKSKLAIQLALKFNGEVVSADAMQLYRGLDVATNKVTTEEMLGVPHHMMSYLDPLTLGYTVKNFRDRAVSLLDDIWSRDSLPVIVGGTNYYIESLVWQMLIDDRLTEEEDDTDLASFQVGVPDELVSLSSVDLHDRLKQIDPESTAQLHPNNRRKIMRCLQVWHTTGVKNSQHLANQRLLDDGTMASVCGPLRLPNTCAFWIQCDQDVLDKRLNDRVDVMVSLGLKEEISRFYDGHFVAQQRLVAEMQKRTGESGIRLKGVFQSIGLKEFIRFLKLSPDDRDSNCGAKLFNEGLEELKMANRRYARRQTKWIAGRFLRKPSRPTPPVFSLNGTDVSRWEELVELPAVRVVQAFLSGSPRYAAYPQQPLPVEPDEFEMRKNEIFTCDVCQKTISGPVQYDKHLRGRQHVGMLRSARKRRDAEESQRRSALTQLSGLLDQMTTTTTD